MRLAALVITMIILGACGPASRLTWDERAYIHCAETGGEPATCMPQVHAAWERLAGACGIRDNVVRICEAEFDRLYGCQVSTREVKRTDDKGNVTTVKEETRSGPGCSMESSRKFQLEIAFEQECLAARNPPDISSSEGASCTCGSWGCNFIYPDVSDETAVRYFPEKAK